MFELNLFKAHNRYFYEENVFIGKIIMRFIKYLLIIELIQKYSRQNTSLSLNIS